MRVLLDHCVPSAVEKHLAEFQVETAFSKGWESIANGKLLSLAESEGFEILLTTDKRMRFQQNMAGRQIALIVIDTLLGTVPEILELMPEVIQAMANAQLGSITVVTLDSKA